MFSHCSKFLFFYFFFLSKLTAFVGCRGNSTWGGEEGRRKKGFEDYKINDVVLSFFFLKN
jgi:hypothetical protein